jgi:hypothetical protein
MTLSGWTRLWLVFSVPWWGLVAVIGLNNIPRVMDPPYVAIPLACEGGGTLVCTEAELGGAWQYWWVNGALLIALPFLIAGLFKLVAAIAVWIGRGFRPKPE